MAKYDNFVSEQNIPFNLDEMNYFKKHCINIVSKFNLKFDTMYIEMNALEIKFLSEPINKRNSKKDRITFKGIIFTIFKQSGYLDHTNWNENKPIQIIKDYDNVPLFQYSAYLNCIGNEIKYRSNKSYPMELNKHFIYDTEINNLTFSEALKDLEIKLF